MAKKDSNKKPADRLRVQTIINWILCIGSLAAIIALRMYSRS